METNRPLILISNDDGVSAPGMRYLIESVRDMGEIIAVAQTDLVQDSPPPLQWTHRCVSHATMTIVAPQYIQ